MTNIFLQETLGALQATISVLLVLGYGAAATGWLKMMPSEVVNGMTKVGVCRYFSATHISLLSRRFSSAKAFDKSFLRLNKFLCQRLSR